MATVATGTRDGILTSLHGSRRRRRKEKAIHGVLAAAAGVSILISAAIVLALLFRGLNFLSHVELGALWSGIWRPRQGQFDLLSLFLGSRARALTTGELGRCVVRREHGEITTGLSFPRSRPPCIGRFPTIRKSLRS